MKFSEVFGFFTILTESIKILPKNGKYMASFTIFSLLLPSILVLFFSYSYQILTNNMQKSITNSSEPDSDDAFFQQTIIYIVLTLLLELACLFAYIVISQVFGIATVLVSATSYTGENLSLPDLISAVRKNWKRKPTPGLTSSIGTRFLMIVVALIIVVAVLVPNYITISIAVVVGVSGAVLQLYSSVVSVMSYVVSIVEESGEGMERGEELVKGRRVDGFMVNLFFNVVVLVVFFGCWMRFEDKWMENLTAVGLVFVNSITLVRLILLVAYTVFYFQCKTRRDEDVHIVGDLQYSKVPTDIP